MAIRSCSGLIALIHQSIIDEDIVVLCIEIVDNVSEFLRLNNLVEFLNGYRLHVLHKTYCFIDDPLNIGNIFERSKYSEDYFRHIFNFIHNDLFSHEYWDLKCEFIFVKCNYHKDRSCPGALSCPKLFNHAALWKRLWMRLLQLDNFILSSSAENPYLSARCCNPLRLDWA